MIQYPKISIVTPNYNLGAFLERTIKSVIDQEYPNLEYIIIDGGSTDGSIDIIKKYEQHLTHWESSKDGGMYDAINKGLTRSSGQIMGWINSDDVLMKGSLRMIADIFTEYTTIEWLGGCALSINEADEIIYANAQRRWNRFMYYSGDYKYIQQEGTFWRRNLWNKVGGSVNSKLKYAGDLELWSRFFAYADYYTLPAPIGGFRKRRENQKTLESLHLYHQEAEMILSHMQITEWDKKVLKSQGLYKKLKGRVPFMQRFFNRILKASIYRYPPMFNYDLMSNRFILNKQ